MPVDNNNQRALTDAAFVLAWRDRHDDTTYESKVFVDVGFRTARLGGEAEAEVQFRLSLKRATIAIKILNNDEGRIVPSSIRREGIIKKEKSVRKISKSTSETDNDLTLNLSSTSNFGGEIGHSSRKGVSIGSEKIENFTEHEMRVLHFIRGSVVEFSIDPVESAFLDGSPWSVKEEILRVLCYSQSKLCVTSPVIVVEVLCKREDMHIFDIALKMQKWIPVVSMQRKKMMIVEQYLKNETIKSGFNSIDMKNPFSNVTLADCIVWEENNV